MMLRALMNVNWDSRGIRALDWGLAAASLVVFLVTGDLIWLVGAIIGAISAWYRPLSRLQTYLRGMVRRPGSRLR